MSKEKINLIIVDDHQIVLDGLISMLNSIEQINILGSFRNSLDAFTFVQDNSDNLHIVVTDVSMPDVSGIELCKKIKALHKDIKVLFLSMYNSKEVIREAIWAEADGYTHKDCHLDQLVNAINKIYKGGTYFTAEIISAVSESTLLEKDASKTKLNELTEREREILYLIVNDFTSEEIASKLFISVKTVGHHRQHILAKTGCKSSVGLAKFALAAGVV